ncbi:hypothetical protein AO380_1690 [Moraxella catarrhalis]|nr:hypothetical protein AO380_1690 [Moraxella catarrhalis]
MNKRIKDYFYLPIPNSINQSINQSIKKMNTPSPLTNQTLGYFSPI